MMNGSMNNVKSGATRVNFTGSSQYIIEMKIWHGNEYNTRGEEQLLGYLEDYHLEYGYMLRFNFNKKIGVKEYHFENHTLVEAVV